MEQQANTMETDPSMNLDTDPAARRSSKVSAPTTSDDEATAVSKDEFIVRDGELRPLSLCAYYKKRYNFLGKQKMKGIGRTYLLNSIKRLLIRKGCTAS